MLGQRDQGNREEKRLSETIDEAERNARKRSCSRLVFLFRPQNPFFSLNLNLLRSLLLSHSPPPFPLLPPYKPKQQSVKDLPIVQDGPPPGGFPAVRYARRIPSTGPAGATLFAVGAAVMAFGFYRVGQGNRHRREVRREKVARREALYPVLQAEEDRAWVARKAAAEEKERELMKGVEGWEAGKSVYSPGARWVPPAAPYGSWGASG